MGFQKTDLPCIPDSFVLHNFKIKEFFFQIVEDEGVWDARQISFLETHKYHTVSNTLFRDPLKNKHLEAISV